MENSCALATSRGSYMVPAQKRPQGSALPSLNRVVAVSCVAFANSCNGPPHSRARYTPSRRAITRPLAWPCASRAGAMLPGSEGMGQLCVTPVAASKRWISWPGMSIQYSLRSSGCQKGDSPNSLGWSSSVAMVFQVMGLPYKKSWLLGNDCTSKKNSPLTCASGLNIQKKFFQSTGCPEWLRAPPSRHQRHSKNQLIPLNGCKQSRRVK